MWSKRKGSRFYLSLNCLVIWDLWLVFFILQWRKNAVQNTYLKKSGHNHSTRSTMSCKSAVGQWHAPVYVPEIGQYHNLHPAHMHCSVCPHAGLFGVAEPLLCTPALLWSSSERSSVFPCCMMSSGSITFGWHASCAVSFSGLPCSDGNSDIFMQAGSFSPLQTLAVCSAP